MWLLGSQICQEVTARPEFIAVFSIVCLPVQAFSYLCSILCYSCLVAEVNRSKQPVYISSLSAAEQRIQNSETINKENLKLS